MGSIEERNPAPITDCRRVLCPFSLVDYKLHHAVVSGSQQLRITTSSNQWSYAVAFPTQGDTHDVSSCLLIRIDATVEAGCIGFGILDENESDFLVEIQQDSSHDAAYLDLICESIPKHALLMIRNCAADGVVSQLSINDIEAFSVRIDLPTDCESLPTQRDSLRPVVRWNRYYGNDFSDVGDRVRAMQYESLCETQPMVWLDGLRIEIHPNNEMSRAAFISGLYEPNLLIALQQLLKAGDTVLDIGANIGFISLFAARCIGPTGTIHSFEPSRREFERLCQNIELNKLTNVRPIPFAVTDQIGVAELSVADEYHGGHNTLSAEFGYQTTTKLRAEQVQTTTIDSYVASEDLNKVDAIKIDVEGAEHQVLSSARKTIRRFRPVLVLEASAIHLDRHDRSLADLRSLLREYGYSIWDIRESDAKLQRLSDSADIVPENIVAVPREEESRIPRFAQCTDHDRNQSKSA